jgi:hypothetical protein
MYGLGWLRFGLQDFLDPHQLIDFVVYRKRLVGGQKRTHDVLKVCDPASSLGLGIARKYVRTGGFELPAQLGLAEESGQHVGLALYRSLQCLVRHRRRSPAINGCCPGNDWAQQQQECQRPDQEKAWLKPYLRCGLATESRQRLKHRNAPVPIFLGIGSLSSTGFQNELWPSRLENFFAISRTLVIRPRRRRGYTSGAVRANIVIRR